MQKVSIILVSVAVAVAVVSVGPIRPQEGVSHGSLVVGLSRGFKRARVGSSGSGSLVGDVDIVGKGWHCADFQVT